MQLIYGKQWQFIERKIAEESAIILLAMRSLLENDAMSALKAAGVTVRRLPALLLRNLDACAARLFPASLETHHTLPDLLALAGKKIWILPVLMVAAFAVAVWSSLLLSLPDISDPRVWNPSGTIVVQDRNGKDMYFAYEKEDRVWLEKDQIPTTVKQAFIAIEDKRFFERRCIDWRAIGRAFVANTTDYKSQGASTITQQLVRTALLSPEKKFVRKIKEIILACQLESTTDKEDILTAYLNWISFGGVTGGVQQASRRFFEKDVDAVTVAEAAVLASMTQRPTYYSPYGPHRYTRLTASGETVIGLTGTSATLSGDSGSVMLGGRAHQVLANMLRQGYIGNTVKTAADKELLTLTFRPDIRSLEAPHYVLSMLEDLKKTIPADVLDDQLSVVTTIDSDLQTAAEDLAAQHAERIAKKYNAHNVAMVVADTRTHEILAYVGNVDFFGSASGAKIDMVTVPRQPGSSFKPIVYAASMEYAGWKPTTIVYDTALEIGGARPRNYAGDFEGPIPVIQALNHSRNIPAIRAFNAVGEDPILNLAARIGAPTPLDVSTKLSTVEKSFEYNWPLAIGAAEVPLLEMVQAYTTFANSGMYQPLRGVRAIEDADGYSYSPEAGSSVRAIPSEVADNITAMLSESQSRPEGFWQTVTNVPGIQEAVKTGTSNVCLERDKKGTCKKMLPRDVWAIGYTPAFIVGVWMGNVDGAALTANADGLNAAVPLWREMLVAVHKSPLGENAPRTFSGAQIPYYTQHPSVKPKKVPETDIAVEPTWFLASGNRAFLSRKQ